MAFRFEKRPDGEIRSVHSDGGGGRAGTSDPDRHPHPTLNPSSQHGRCLCMNQVFKADRCVKKPTSKRRQDWTGHLLGLLEDLLGQLAGGSQDHPGGVGLPPALIQVDQAQAFGRSFDPLVRVGTDFISPKLKYASVRLQRVITRNRYDTVV